MFDIECRREIMHQMKDAYLFDGLYAMRFYRIEKLHMLDFERRYDGVMCMLEDYYVYPRAKYYGKPMDDDDAVSDVRRLVPAWYAGGPEW